jgi:hypothetical protein
MVLPIHFTISSKCLIHVRLSISAAILLYLRAFVSLLYALLAPSSNNRYIQDPSDLLFNIAIWW